MPKVTLNDLGSGYASSALLDENFDTIETAFDNTLSRDGTTPNQMEADLDMNSNRIINLDDPVNDQDAATKAWILGQEGNAAQDAIDAAASADAAADSEAAALASENNAEAWATQLNSLVESTDYSSKEWAIGSTVEDGSSKEWATNPEDAAVGDAAGFSALHYAAKAQAAAAALTIPDSVIYFHPQVLMTDVTVPAEYNGWVVGPWQVDPGATLTIEAGANFYVQPDPATLVVDTDVIPIATGGTGATTAADARTNLGVDFKGALLKLTSSQTGSSTIVAWDAEEYDTDGFWSSGNAADIVIPSGVSRVRLYAGGYFNGGTLGKIVKNYSSGSSDDYTGEPQYLATSGTPWQASIVSPPISVTAGDTFSLRVDGSWDTLSLWGEAYLAVEVVE